jgi:hypothetical protein
LRTAAWGIRQQRRFTCDRTYARAGGLTSAPGCPKLAQACGEAGRRKTAGLAEDTPRKTRGGPRLPRTNWMCRPDQVVAHCKVTTALREPPFDSVGSLRASVLSAGRDRVSFLKSVNSTNRTETVRSEVSQGDPKGFTREFVSRVGNSTKETEKAKIEETPQRGSEKGL